MNQPTKRQQEIVRAAIVLIANHGFQSFTTKRLALELGVTEPALYRHFTNKLAIMLGILAHFEEVSLRIRHSFDHPQHSGVQLIELFLRDRYMIFSNDPEIAKVMFAEEIFLDETRLAPKILQIMDEHRNLLIKAIRQGQSEGTIRTDITFNQLFHIIVGSMRLIIDRWCLSGYGFDLNTEGMQLWEAIKKLITPGKSVT